MGSRLSLLTLACVASLFGCSGSVTSNNSDAGAFFDAGASSDSGSTPLDGAPRQDAGDDDFRDGEVRSDAGPAFLRCVVDETRICFDGDVSLAGVGACRIGTQVCVEVPGGSEWGECSDQVLPGPDICDNGFDDDCDGTIDQTCGNPAAYGPFDAWSQCSVECGGGMQIRARGCFLPDGDPRSCSECGDACDEVQACNTHACPDCAPIADGYVCYTPGVQQITVPAGVNEVLIDAWGGGGAGGTNPDVFGGGAAMLGVRWLRVPPGTLLTVEVAEGGRSPGGGGGATHVSIDGSSEFALFVGGGGGAGSDGCTGCYGGGAGGAAAGRGNEASAGEPATHPDRGTANGGGGGTPLSSGVGGSFELSGTIGSGCWASGLPGAQNRGGTGAGGSGTSCQQGAGGGDGWHGGLGVGNGAGGGGGSGYFGGGGGGAGYTVFGGGGGGGSSYTPGGVRTSSNGSRERAGGTGQSTYVAGVGEGGAVGSDGGPGLVVIEFR